MDKLQLIHLDTRQKTVFEPRDPQHVTLYVCGPTVYDRVHLGNARPNVVFDVLYRVLKQQFGKVTYVRNITDVDDKIIQRAKKLGQDIDALTQDTIAQFHKDMDALHILPPTIEPRATAHIPQMIEMIQKLVAGGHAYVAESHVLFDVSSDAAYGSLSNRDIDQLLAGARVDVAPYKKNPTDFVLWKPAQETEPGWESPWGRGRPGWHIECSAMSAAHLGASFDIHGGGRDLIFPHHENEAAQSRCANGAETFAKYWMHCGMLTVSGQKMSKSLGNFISMETALENTPGEVLRYALMMTHYRHPLDWTPKTLKNARIGLDRLYGGIKAAGDLSDFPEQAPSKAVLSALYDDLNTPRALSALYEITKQIHSVPDKEKAALGAQLKAGAAYLGLLNQTASAWFQGDAGNESVGELTAAVIDVEIQARLDARRSKDFARADEIRGSLEEKGIVLEDTPTGTTWRRKPMARPS